VIQPLHTPHLSYTECLERYPRICRAVQWMLLGSLDEAACCLRDYRDGMPFGSEAVSHSGLSPLHRVQTACSYHVRKLVRKYSPVKRRPA
jgi:hypothetical protein